MQEDKDHPDAFLARRDNARARLDELTGAKGGSSEDRAGWFRTVYDAAEGDPAAVPWADLKPKQALTDWLTNNPGHGKRALDVACGLGDNAEALAEAGYDTTAFDLVEEAVSWAQRRFPQSTVEYRTGDLFNLPSEWKDAFDLVHECYTLQALKEPLRSQAFASLGDLVAPGGCLLIITRSREEEAQVEGPPWPLTPSEWRRFENLGFELQEKWDYEVKKGDRVIPHVKLEYRRAI